MAEEKKTEATEETVKTAATTIHTPKPHKGDQKKAKLVASADARKKIQESRLKPTNLNPYPAQKSPYKAK